MAARPKGMGRPLPVSLAQMEEQPVEARRAAVRFRQGTRPYA
jgi:hypothetical protein